MRDVINLEGVVNSMVITGKHNFECGICIEGKMTVQKQRVR